MPLGFRWNPSPDVTLECDLSQCRHNGRGSVSSLACGHSFHNDCLRKEGELLPCQLCWPNLKKEISKLTSSWNKGLLTPQKSQASPGASESSGNTDLPDDGIPEIPSRNSEYYTSQSLATDLKETVDGIHSPTTVLYPSAEARRNEQSTTPSNVSTCRPVPVPVHTLALPVIPSQQHGSVTSWMFPPEFSQSTIFGRSMGSNACTFIALLTGSAYVANASILHLPNSWFVVLAQYMVNGNNIYDAVTRQTPRMFGVNDAATLVKQTTGITKVSQEHQCDFDAPLQSAQLSNFVRK